MKLSGAVLALYLLQTYALDSDANTPQHLILNQHSSRPSRPPQRSLLQDIRLSWRSVVHRRIVRLRPSHLTKRVEGSDKCHLVLSKDIALGTNGSVPETTSPSISTTIPIATASVSFSSTTTSHTSRATTTSARRSSSTTTSRTSTSASPSPTATTSSSSSVYIPPPTSSSSSTSSATPSPSSIFTLKQSYSGSTFFNEWNFQDSVDDSHGTVNYQSSTSAWGQNLISFTSDQHAILKVDTTSTVSANRNSIRISSQFSFNGGLVIGDFVHMPIGCGVWPAFWTVGANAVWPQAGEIDIMEGVHSFTSNLVSLHTKAGCTLASDYGATGTPVNGYDCGSSPTQNSGCGLQSNVGPNYGAAFNNAGGGVYAMLWDNSGIRVFFFSRSSIPDDITNDAPLPETWGEPAARFPASTCDPYAYNKDHVIVLNINLCGDLGGVQSIWESSGYASGGGSCLASTGAATCVDWVRGNGGAFQDAYWEVKSIKVFQ